MSNFDKDLVRGKETHQGKTKWINDSLVAIPFLKYLSGTESTATYEELAIYIGNVHRLSHPTWEHPNEFSAVQIGPRVLHPLKSHCLYSSLPPLNNLIVSKRNGKPGKGATDGWTLDEVYNHDWSKFNPSYDELLTDVKFDIGLIVKRDKEMAEFREKFANFQRWLKPTTLEENLKLIGDMTINDVISG